MLCYLIGVRDVVIEVVFAIKCRSWVLIGQLICNTERVIRIYVTETLTMSQLRAKAVLSDSWTAL